MRISRCLLVLALLLNVWATGACRRATAGVDSATVATINQESVRREEFAAHEKEATDFLDDDADGRVRSQLLDDYIKFRLILREAKRLGINPATPEQSTDPTAASDVTEVAPQTQADQERALVESYQRQVVMKDLSVSPAEVETYYQQNRVRFQRQNGYYLRDIRVADRAEAENLYRQITKMGADFAQLARDNSLSPTAPQGGLRYYEDGQMPPAFEKAVHDLNPKQVSTIVTTEYGFHIFRMEGRAEPLTLEQAIDQIKQELVSAKSRTLVETNSQRLISSAQIKVYPDALGFRYTGQFAHQ